MAQPDAIETARLDEMQARMQARENEALKSYLAMIRLSKYRYHVARLAADDRGFWYGSVVYGPATHEQCAAFIEVEKLPKPKEPNR